MRTLAWDLIIPVKRLEAAKSRLAGLEAADRQRLALSFATDAVEAARSATRVARVLVVTEDALAAAELGLRGATIIGETRGPGLNPAIEAGIDAALLEDSVRRIAVMTGDLPAVSPEDIDGALALAAAHRRAILADADGTGTVLLTGNPWAGGTAAPPYQSFGAREVPEPVRPHPRFGFGSFAHHVAAGHVPLAGAFPGLRRDVDTRVDLEAAQGLGLGAATGAQLAVLSLGSSAPRGRRRPAPSPR
ncbi:2-phospho-L-lactate guanylyltransferase [Brevibacterium yomogidense]|uniref:2-phospho-L-lactate guanylyltransferase n=1 Tax=Brevibacterium yomogidense TaxID=946573 RepID=UPI000B360E8D|nr:2-phospho-L-lactate guanylyltransferase [Brevibacterium yomogidense]